MSKKIGDYGEDLAGEYLVKNGYRIVERNFRTRFGEIDIIAKEGKVICFVEVKYKVDEGFGAAVEMISAKKISKILKTAKIYLMEADILSVDWRLDVVAIDGEKDSCELIKNVYIEGMGVK